MPSSAVTVEATFKAEGTEGEGEGETATLPFTDVEADDWYYEAVSYVWENKMMNGVSDTEFAPETNLTRAMLVTVLYRLENEKHL